MCHPHSQVPTVGSSRLLFATWKTHDEIVQVSPTGHAICSTCSDIHSDRLALEGVYDPVRTAELDAEAEAHLAFHSTERKYYDDAVETATHRPHLVTTLTIDAPTKHQLDLPCQARWKRDTSKKLDGKGRWQSKLEAVLNAGVGMMVYLCRVSLGCGANLVCTVLFLSLMTHYELGRPFGRRLHLQLDNTTSENKNSTLIGAVALLVAWGVFDEAVIFFMPVGHTYNELDAAFSPLIQSLVKVALGTVSSLIAFVKEALAGKGVREVCQLYHLWDFDSLMQEHMHSLGGFARTQQSSGMHEFHVKRDRAGNVRLRARQSSQSSSWFPEGEGELVFKSLPSREEPPPMAKPMYTAHQWRRSEVCTTVRRWLPAIGLTCGELNAAVREWEEQFDDAVDDVDLLPHSKHLAWRTLPVVTDEPSNARSQQQSSDNTGGRARDMIENPPINPMYGASRRVGQVRAELLEWQQEQRVAAAHNVQVPPVFLGEYLLVWSSPEGNRDRSIVLGRVCGVPAGGAITKNAVVDLLLYEHTPQDGVEGLFGSFSPKKNPDFSDNQRGSSQFMRLRDVGRDRIIVYSVVTFGPATSLQVAVESLDALTIAVGEAAHRMPENLPDSHRDDLPRARVSQSSARRRAQPSNDRPPAVPNGKRIAVNWTEEPIGWFKGTVTSSRRDDDMKWVSRVLYDRCEQWRSHAAWHILDREDENAVEWRLLEASDNDDSDSDSSD